jgi:exopolysaccharide biosynthesis polyprenyl glycosylphosphotransferase
VPGRQKGEWKVSVREQVHAVSRVERWRGARPILFLTHGEHPNRLVKHIAERKGRTIEIVRVVGSLERREAEKFANPLAPEALRGERPWGVVVASGLAHRLPTSLLLQCRLNGICVLDESSFCEREGRCIDIDGTDLAWLLRGEGFRHGRIADLAKRLFDLSIATALILLTLPLMALVALAIWCDSRGPILHRQERIGWSGRVFALWKFRSMRRDAEPGGRPIWAAKGDPRVTRVGRLIRYTRIDELPQLWNVLRGEMSLVGPRPERPFFVDQLSSAIPLYAARHSVKPGITGWAQVNASYGASLDDAREKLRYDLYYIKNRSLILDLRILLSTVRVILFQEGAR